MSYLLCGADGRSDGDGRKVLGDRTVRIGMDRIPTACPECGVTWYRGGTATSRKHHRKVDEDSWQCTECHVVVPEP